MDDHGFWVWDKCQVADWTSCWTLTDTALDWWLLKLIPEASHSCTYNCLKRKKSIHPPDVRNDLIEYLIKRQRRKTWSLYRERAHCSIFRVSALQSQSWMEIRSWLEIGDDMMVHCDKSWEWGSGDTRSNEQWHVTLFVYKARIIPSLPSRCQLSFIFLQNHQKITWI